MNQAGPGLNMDPNEIIYSGCDCTTPSCDQNCPCIQRFGASYTQEGKVILQPCEDLAKDKTDMMTKPVVECNSSCRCSSDCINRVVQNGILHKLQVFKSDRKGWALRALEPILSNSFVCEYAGEILPFDEAKQRTKSLTKDDMNYILVVRETVHKGEVIKTYIDPTHIGNVGRFINHSCSPTLFQVIARVENEIPRVALFTRKDIKAYEELTYSYWGDRHDTGDSVDRHLRKPCLCRSVGCTGFLPVDSTLF